MKSSHEWNPAALLQSPLLAPLHPLLSCLTSVQFPTLSDYNELLECCQTDICVQQGHHVRFVPQKTGKMGFEAQYEPRCYLTGEVQTRSDNFHDLFNALVWLTFPKAKAAINNRHYHALTNVDGSESSQRGRVRDMTTLLDESGVVVVCANAELAELLRTFQWKELFWKQRVQLEATMGFYIFGHGLYEKAMKPYVGMTGQGLIINAEPDFFLWDMATRMAYLDKRVAEYLNDSQRCVSPRELNPVPLLGVPGWDIQNNNAAYYDNSQYFRAGRRDKK